jgi:hypothetical protein
MAAPKTGNTAPKKIDIEQLEKCAEKQWNNTEIAAFFRVSTKTLERRYVEIIEKARQRGKTKLKDLQWKRALEGSDKMIVHMSKHYLGQHDRIEDVTKLPDDTLAQEAERRLNAIKDE